jgi:TonB-linked SusC/RagA family outer membrane protein
MKVTMADNAVELEGVVVTALGIKREKKALGFSATTLKNESLTQVTNSNPFESLSGKVAGVDISSPQQPGASTKIIVRGFHTISGTNAPLYVVDGSPINRSSSGNTGITRSYDAGTGINDLDPNIIESITFLKGAAATALYGSAGGNGVFIITTKHGKNQSKLNIDFSTSIEGSQVARVPHNQTSYGQGWDGKGWDVLADGTNGASNQNGSWGPAFNGEIRPWGSIYNNSQLIKPYVSLDNNLRDFFDAGLLTSNSVTVSGGTDFSDFALSFSNLNSDGIFPTTADKYLKRSFSMTGGINGKKLSLRTSLNFANKDQNVVNQGQSDEAGEGRVVMQELLQTPTDVSVVDMADQSNPFYSPSYFYTPYASNPYFQLTQNATKITGNNIYGNANLSWKIIPELTAAWQVGGNYRTEILKSHGASVTYEDGSPQAAFQTLPVAGGVTEGRKEWGEFDSYATLTWNKKWSDKFDMTLIGGTALNQKQSNFLSTSITNLVVPGFYELSNTAIMPNVAQFDTKERTFGLFAQAELTYNEKIFLTLSARQDRNSTLPAGNDTYFYPSAALSGILIDNGKHFLKLRAGVATVGHGTGVYQTSSSLIRGAANAYFGQVLAPLGGINYYELGGLLGNDKLKPELNTEFEVGTEGSLYNGRITFDISVYRSKTKDLITQVPIDPANGYTSQTRNIGDLENKGIELTLGLTPVKTTDFRWDINYTFSKNKNEMLSINGTDKILINSAYGVSFYAIEGQPLGVFEALTAQRTDAGQIIVDPASGMAKPTLDPQILGNSQRDFTMGLQNTLKYKNLALSFSWDWKKGGKMYSYTDRLTNFSGNSIFSTYNDREPFIIPNSVIADPANPGQYIENTTAVQFSNTTSSDGRDITDYFGNTQVNPSLESAHVIDKSFIRLREVNLTYTFSTKITDKLGLSKLSFGIYGKNLFLWTPSENPYVDPEATNYGNELASEFGEFGANPSQRSYGAIMKLSF